MSDIDKTISGIFNNHSFDRHALSQ